MAVKFRIGEQLPALVEKIVDSYNHDERTRHIDSGYLPNRAEIEDIIQLLLEISYPGYFGRQNLNPFNIRFHVGELLPKLGEKLFEQVLQALCYQTQCPGKFEWDCPQCRECEEQAREITLTFLDRIATVREMLAGDVQAAYDGDPAAVNTDEVILAYPGVLAITVYRYAHELHEQQVPLLPRIMTEWAHMTTGVDIHPGATIGRNFFIDHGTGVVIGETTVIGNSVKLYQGVTLGALSFPKDERGRLIRGYKRHPTVEEQVTIYANATVLGGDTVIGKGSEINGSVFLTNSVPPDTRVGVEKPQLKVRQRNSNGTSTPPV